MPEQEYHNELALSSSALKDFRNMPPSEWKKIWITKEKEGKKSVALGQGSLTDDLLFNPSIVEKKYLIMEIKKPSAAISYIVENIFIPEASIGDLKDKILEFAKKAPMIDNKVGYGQTWKEDTLFIKVVDEGKEYYEFLKKSNGRHVIASEEYMASLLMSEAMKKNEAVKPYLDPKLNKFQFKILTHDDFPDKLKGCMDIFHIDKKAKELQIVDFKTADSAYYFIINIIKFGYLEQLSFYDNLLRWWLQQAGNEKYLEYKILPPMNIVIDKTHAIPYFYEYNMQDIMAAWNGYFKYGKMQKGLKDWIREIQWHILNDKWDYPMEHYLYNKIQVNLIHHGK